MKKYKQRASKYTIDLLKPIVAKSKSKAEVLRSLGLSSVGGHKMLRAMIDSLDTSHFTGQAWMLGKSFGSKHPIEEYLANNGRRISSHALKLRLIKDGLKKWQCEICLITEWMQQPTPIELDHINGIRWDNRIENLRILCPNCHAQTETYCSKNIKNLRNHGLW